MKDTVNIAIIHDRNAAIISAVDCFSVFFYGFCFEYISAKCKSANMRHTFRAAERASQIVERDSARRNAPRKLSREIPRGGMRLANCRERFRQVFQKKSL